ncbi:MAG: T9SS type A sorting domain-containing protein [Flavobacteriales bacterium]
MKKIYLLAFSICAILSASAQYKYAPAALGRSAERGGITVSNQYQLPENRVTIWESDVTNCADFVTGTANEDAGLTQFVDGVFFVCGTDGATGPAAIDPIASTSGGNFMCVDSDVFGGSIGGDYIENCWFQTANAINCSAYDHVSIKFENFYRMWDGGASDGNEYCLVEISTDGTTWPDLTTFEVSEAPAGTRFELWPTMETQDPVINPTVKVFDISEVAANAPQVWIRFRWKGTWGYAWMVDDIEVFETLENDLTAVKAFNGDILADYEYVEIPESQLTDLVCGVIIDNYGYTDQTVDATFNFDGGPPFTAGDTYLATSTDTTWTAAQTVTGVGDHTLNVSLPNDDDNTFNSTSKNFEITTGWYNQCSDEPLTQRGFDQDDEIAIGNVYVINADAEATGIQVYFGTNTSDDVVLQAVVHQMITSIQDMEEYVAFSEEFVLDGSFIDNGYVSIGFGGNDGSGAVTLTAGNAYVVEIRKMENNSDRLYLRADQLDDDLSTACYGPFGAGDAINWYNGWSFSPAVRLVLDDESILPLLPTGISELSANDVIEVQQNRPNPADVSTVINYNLKSSERVTITVRDMTGRIVKTENLGNQSQGAKSYELNVADLGAGMYTYTITAGEVSLTKEMIVK